MKRWMDSTIKAAVCFALAAGLFGLLSGGREVAAAAATRVAVVTELKGTVQVKKAGGAKKFNAFKNMSLNEGDTITTGKGSKAVLQLASSKADRDSITIGENSEVHFTKLKEDTGAKAKMTVWAGSLWVKVKSISNVDDQFEVETPTAIMGVRGTHFIMVVNPQTSEMYLVVTSGIVQASTPQTPGQTANVYPAQQISLAPSETPVTPQAAVSVVDLNELLPNITPELIEEITRETADISEENNELARRLLEQVGEGVNIPDNLANLMFMSEEDLEAYLLNMDIFVAALIKQSVEQGILAQDQAERLIEEINAAITDPDKRIRLDEVPELDPSAGLNAEYEEERRQYREERQRQWNNRTQRQEHRIQQFGDEREALLEQKRQQEETNREKEKTTKEQAERRYVELLTDEERERFMQQAEERQKERQEQEQTGETDTDPGSGSSPAPSPGPSPGPGPQPEPGPSPSVAASLSTYSSNTITVDIALNGFTGSRAIYGYQADVEYDERYFMFDSYFEVAADGALNLFRNLPDSPFRPELEDGWQPPAGYNINAVDRLQLSEGKVRYSLLKFSGGAEEVDGKFVVKLPFMIFEAPEPGEQIPFIITLTAVDAAGNVISGVKPVTLYAEFDQETNPAT